MTTLTLFAAADIQMLTIMFAGFLVCVAIGDHRGDMLFGMAVVFVIAGLLVLNKAANLDMFNMN
jgi:uncharacterized membrane protein YccC